MSQPRLSGTSKTGGGPVMVSACAEASATEEPDAEKLHVRVCAGGAGEPASLPRRGAAGKAANLEG